MPCNITFTPIGATEPITLKEAEWITFLATPDENGITEYEKLEKKLANTDNALPPIKPPTPPKGKAETNDEGGKKEELQQRNRAADKEGKDESTWLKDFRENVVTPKGLKEIIAEMGITKDTLANSKVFEQAQELIDSYKEEYDNGDNNKDVIDRFIEEAKNGTLSDTVGQVVTQILLKNTAIELTNALKEGDKQKANYFFDLQADIIEAYTNQGTDAGRALQVRQAFTKYMFNDPQLADYFYRKTVAKSNQKAKQDATNKASAKEISAKIEKARKAAAKKVAAEIAGDVTLDIEKEISRKGGIGKNASEAKKKQVDDFFSKLLIDETKTLNNKALGAIIPINVIIDAKKYNKFVLAVRDLVKGSMDLQEAISRTLATMIKDTENGISPKEADAMKALLRDKKKELTTPKAKTELQLQREAANEELKAAKKEYSDKQKAEATKIKELEAKSKEAQDVLDTVDKENFKRIVNLQKEIVKLEEEKRAAEKKQRDKDTKQELESKEKIEALAKLLREKENQAVLDAVEKENFKRITKELEIAKKAREEADKARIAENKKLASDTLAWEEKLAALKAKEQQAIENANAKRELEAAVTAQKIAEDAKKQLDKDIQRLAKEVIDAAKKSDTNSIEAIIEMFYSKEEQLQSDLEQMVVTALGVTPKEAVKIAEKIKDAMETKLRAKLIDQLATAIGKEPKPLTEDEKAAEKKKQGYLSPLISGYVGIKKRQGDIIDKLLKLSMMGVLKTDDIMDLMKKKYGINEFTMDMANYVKSQAIKINAADSQARKNKEMAKMTDKMAELAPLYYHEMMNSLWYSVGVLSGIGTQDANLTFNVNQIKNSVVRALAVSVANNLFKKGGGNITERGKSIVNDISMILARGLYQDKLNSDTFKNMVSKKGLAQIIPFSSSGTNLAFGIQEGTTSYAETEKALESQSQSELNYSRYKKIFGYLNFGKYVGRILASVDLAAQDLIKNAWIVPILREEYRKQGLAPRAIDAKIKQEIMHNQVEIDNAMDKALNDIIKYDITVEKKNGKYEVQYNGKKVLSADTEQEANDLKEEAAKKQGTAIRRFAYEFLQNGINEKALKSATHLSQETIMSAAPSGVASAFAYNAVINAKSTLTKWAREAEKEARASNKTSTKLFKGVEARAEYAAMRVLPFVKMGINLVENFFVKDNPIGYWRAVQNQNRMNNPVTNKDKKLADFYQTEVQIEDLKARAIIGTVTIMIPLLGYVIKSLIGDDEDKKKKELEQKRLKRDDTAVIDMEEELGEKIDEDSPYLLIPKNGEKFGSLDFLDVKVRKALENAGLAKEHSEYIGEYPNGRFESIVADPSKFNFTETVKNTLDMLIKYKKGNKKDKISDEDLENSLYALTRDASLYAALSFGSFSITKRQKNIIQRINQGEGTDVAIEQVEGLFPELAVANPSFIKQNIRYIDGAAREIIKPSKDFVKYAETKIPILGSFISVYGSDKRYGMFGEEMYSVPSMVQGAVSSYYFDMRFGDKNKKEKEMYQFLAATQYNKIKSMPSTLSILSEDGTKEVVITPEERNKLGVIAGKKALSKLEQEKTYISSLPLPVAEKYIDRVFDIEYKDAWLKEKDITKNDVKKEDDYVKAKETAEKQVEKLGNRKQFIIDHEGTKEELDLEAYIIKHKAMKIPTLKAKLQKSTDPSTDIKRYKELKWITDVQQKELENELK